MVERLVDLWGDVLVEVKAERMVVSMVLMLAALRDDLMAALRDGK